MNVHELTLQNYAAGGGCPSACQPILYLGTAGSYGNEQINVVLGEGWQGLTVKAVFHPSGVPVVVPDGGGVISVPWEATQSVVAYPHGRISFQGYVSGRLVNTSDVPYTVGGSSAGTDNTPAPTPDEFQQFVDAVKSDADRAAQAAADAEAAAQDVKDAGTQAVTDIGNAKDSALEAIGQTEQAAINQVRQAGATQASAVQSAGATQISQINSAGTAQVQAVKDEGATQVQAVKDEGAAQTSALDDAAAAHKTELDAIASHPPQPNTATGKWQIWNAETGAYQDTDALYQGGYYTPAVSDDGVLTWQGSQAGMPSLPSVNIKGPKGDKGDPGLGVPTPTTSDAGKVPTVKADGSTYELAGPYAPLSAAIRPTASGNPVSITDSVEWSLQGLKVYGKSTQMTTTGAQLFDITKATAAAAAYGVNISIEGEEIRLMGTFNKSGTLQFRLIRVPEHFPDGSKISYFDASGMGISEIQNLALPVSIDDPYIIIALTPVALDASVDYHFKIMVSQDTPTSWEPYTGGKPSPSPEYPQPIVSAGEGGSIALTISDGADRSQSLTLSTPNGLPGIPVNSGGNYTDASGQQWVCDEVDFARGVYAKRANTFKVPSNYAFKQADDFCNLMDENNSDKYLVDLLPGYAVANILNTVSAKNTIIGNSNGFFYIRTRDVTSIFGSLETLNGLVSDGALELLYPTNIIETPLTPEEIAAYRTLHSYDGTTVVSTAEDVAGLEVKYVADAQKYIDDRLAAAESHIQEIAATQLNAQTGG